MKNHQNIKMPFDALIWVLFCIVACLSLYYLLMLGWYNVPALDDYGMTETAERMGLIKTVIEVYQTFAGRYVWYFFTHLECLLFGRMTNLVLMTIKNLLFCYACTWFFLRYLLHFGTGWKLWVFSAFLTNMTIICQPTISTFFWLCASAYIEAMFLLLPLLVAFFSDEINTYLRWGIIIIVSFLLGGSAENFTPLILLGLSSSFVYCFFTKGNWNYFKSEQGLMLMVSMGIMFANFLVVFFAPGNWVRISRIPDAMIYRENFEFIPFVLKDFQIIVAWFVKSLAYTPCYLLIILIFTGIANTNNGVRMTKYTWKHLLSCAIAFLLFVIVEQTICLYGTGDGVYDRAGTFLYAGMVLLSVLLGIVIGNTIKKHSGAKVVCALSCLCLICIFVSLIWQTQPIVKEYHNYINNIRAQVESEVQNNRTTTFVMKNYVKPYTPAIHSIVYNATACCFKRDVKFFESFFPYIIFELTDDSSCWENFTLKRYFNAQFDIVAQDYKGPYNR